MLRLGQVPFSTNKESQHETAFRTCTIRARRVRGSRIIPGLHEPDALGSVELHIRTLTFVKVRAGVLYPTLRSPTLRTSWKFKIC